MRWEPKRAPRRNNGGQETTSYPRAQLYLQAFLHILHAALCVCLDGDADRLLMLLVLIGPLGHQTCRHGQGHGHHQSGMAGVARPLCPGDPGEPRLAHAIYPASVLPTSTNPSAPTSSCWAAVRSPVSAASQAGDPNPGAWFGGEGEAGRREMGEQGGCGGHSPLPLHGSVGIWTV